MIIFHDIYHGISYFYISQVGICLYKSVAIIYVNWLDNCTYVITMCVYIYIYMVVFVYLHKI